MGEHAASISDTRLRRRFLGIAVALLLTGGALTVVGTVGPPADAALPGENGRIAFSWNHGGSPIAVINPDGTGQVELPCPHFSCHDPAWSPDGSQLAFTYWGGELWVMDADGSNPQQLFDDAGAAGSPTWSPDGTAIAFYADGDILVIDADGSNVTKLTDDGSAIEDRVPAWSPDGLELAFVSGTDNSFDVYVADLAGTYVLNLTNSPSRGGNWIGPDWSPDGTQIVFSSERSGNFEIHVMDWDGGNVQQLTNDPVKDTRPSWSPDGTRIVFERYVDWDEPSLFVMDADGSDVSLLVGKGSYAPDWQPVNSPPFPAPDYVTVAEGGTVSVPAPGLLANDIAWSGSALTVEFYTDPEHGTVEVLDDGSFTYVHDGSETTGDFFSYNAMEGTRLSNDGPVFVTLTPVNDPPAAADDGPYVIDQGGTLAVNGVLDNDTDPEGDSLTAVKVTDPAHGALSLASDGSFTYSHDGSDATSDSFTYRANDGVDSSNIATVAITITPSPAVAASVGLVDPSQGQWHLRDYGSGAVKSFFYGNPGDVPFLGDWDCDGVETPGLFRTSDAYAYLRNSNTVGIADIRFFFGDPADVPLAGDFDGDGCDTLSIYRPTEQRFYIMNELGENEGGLGAAEFSFGFGNPGDKPVVGDWDGDGVDEVGLHRESTGFFYFRNTLDTGVASGEFYFGDPGDRFVAGDWGTVDGMQTPAVFRPSNTTFYFRWTNTPGAADSEFVWGEATWLPVSGVIK